MPAVQVVLPRIGSKQHLRDLGPRKSSMHSRPERGCLGVASAERLSEASWDRFSLEQLRNLRPQNDHGLEVVPRESRHDLLHPHPSLDRFAIQSSILFQLRDGNIAFGESCNISSINHLPVEPKYSRLVDLMGNYANFGQLVDRLGTDVKKTRSLRKDHVFRVDQSSHCLP
jgi:hypothetical protein